MSEPQKWWPEVESPESCSGGTGKSQPADEEKMMEGNGEWMVGRVQTPVGKVPLVSTKLSSKDKIGTFRVCWGIGRTNYRIAPGLYGLGNPRPESPVLVSANYKLSFDTLRKELGGMDAWILVLDTKGINVWCAAGKGTFGTDEVANRVEQSGLARVVNHRTLVLPQLGAPGVAAHEVKKKSGFRVIYGPVRAADIPEFLKSGMEAAPQMRQVHFKLRDRAILVPVELMGVLRHPAFLAVAFLFVLNALGVNFIDIDGLAIFGAIVVGTVLLPLLLPWIPGRPLALKGWLLGLLWALVVSVYRGFMFSPSPSPGQALISFLLLPALSSFLALNFTGSTSFTSLSGVLKEMRVAIPAIIISATLGVGLMVAGMFIKF